MGDKPKVKLELTIEEVYYIRFALARAKQVALDQLPRMEQIVDRWKLTNVADKYAEISDVLGKELSNQIHKRWAG